MQGHLAHPYPSLFSWDSWRHVRRKRIAFRCSVTLTRTSTWKNPIWEGAPYDPQESFKIFKFLWDLFLHILIVLLIFIVCTVSSPFLHIFCKFAERTCFRPLASAAGQAADSEWNRRRRRGACCSVVSEDQVLQKTIQFPEAMQFPQLLEIFWQDTLHVGLTFV